MEKWVGKKNERRFVGILHLHMENTKRSQRVKKKAPRSYVWREKKPKGRLEHEDFV